jgi:hypothetical protein
MGLIIFMIFAFDHPFHGDLRDSNPIAGLRPIDEAVSDG